MRLHDTYSIHERSGTASNVGIAVLAATLAMVGSHSQISTAVPVAAKPIEKPGTIGQFGNQLATTPIEMHAPKFEEAVASFYSKLLDGQESLGQEFEKVLHDNLWDLYTRS